MIKGETITVYDWFDIQNEICDVMGIPRDGPNTEKYLRSMKHIKQIKEHFGVEQDLEEDSNETCPRCGVVEWCGTSCGLQDLPSMWCKMNR